VKPRVAQLEGRQVHFTDGSAVETDTIIYCTGYALRFLFLPGALLEIKQNGVDLYKHVFHPDLPTLAFVGFCNVAGAAQTFERLVADRSYCHPSQRALRLAG